MADLFIIVFVLGLTVLFNCVILPELKGNDSKLQKTEKLVSNKMPISTKQTEKQKKMEEKKADGERKVESMQKSPRQVFEEAYVNSPILTEPGNLKIDKVDPWDTDGWMTIYFSGFSKPTFITAEFARFADFLMRSGADISQITFNYEQEDDYYHADPIHPARFSDYNDYQEHYFERREKATVVSVGFMTNWSAFDNLMVGCSVSNYNRTYGLHVSFYPNRRNPEYAYPFDHFIMEKLLDPNEQIMKLGSR